MTTTEFITIPNFGNKYHISKSGIVYSTHTSKPLKQMLSTSGYSVVKLLVPYTKGLESKQYKTRYVHRLVAEAFIPNPENKPQVNHIDGCKTNNNVLNLEWCTALENTMHAIATGLTTKKVSTNTFSEKENIINRLLNSKLNWYDAVTEMGIHRTNAKKSILKTASELGCEAQVLSLIKTHEQERAKQAAQETAVKNSKPVKVFNSQTQQETTYPSATLAASAIKASVGNVINSCLCGHSVNTIYKCVYVNSVL